MREREREGNTYSGINCEYNCIRSILFSKSEGLPPNNVSHSIWCEEQPGLFSFSKIFFNNEGDICMHSKING